MLLNKVKYKLSNLESKITVELALAMLGFQRIADTTMPTPISSDSPAYNKYVWWYSGLITLSLPRMLELIGKEITVEDILQFICSSEFTDNIRSEADLDKSFYKFDPEYIERVRETPEREAMRLDSIRNNISDILREKESGKSLIEISFRTVPIQNLIKAEVLKRKPKITVDEFNNKFPRIVELCTMNIGYKGIDVNVIGLVKSNLELDSFRSKKNVKGYGESVLDVLNSKEPSDIVINKGEEYNVAAEKEFEFGKVIRTNENAEIIKEIENTFELSKRVFQKNNANYSLIETRVQSQNERVPEKVEELLKKVFIRNPKLSIDSKFSRFMGVDRKYYLSEKGSGEKEIERIKVAMNIYQNLKAENFINEYCVESSSLNEVDAVRSLALSDGTLCVPTTTLLDNTKRGIRDFMHPDYRENCKIPSSSLRNPDYWLIFPESSEIEKVYYLIKGINSLETLERELIGRGQSLASCIVTTQEELDKLKEYKSLERYLNAESEVKEDIFSDNVIAEVLEVKDSLYPQEMHSGKDIPLLNEMLVDSSFNSKQTLLKIREFKSNPAGGLETVPRSKIVGTVCEDIKSTFNTVSVGKFYCKRVLYPIEALNLFKDISGSNIDYIKSFISQKSLYTSLTLLVGMYRWDLDPERDAISTIDSKSTSKDQDFITYNSPVLSNSENFGKSKFIERFKPLGGMNNLSSFKFVSSELCNYVLTLGRNPGFDARIMEKIDANNLILGAKLLQVLFKDNSPLSMTSVDMIESNPKLVYLDYMISYNFRYSITSLNKFEEVIHICNLYGKYLNAFSERESKMKEFKDLVESNFDESLVTDRPNREYYYALKIECRIYCELVLKLFWIMNNIGHDLDLLLRTKKVNTLDARDVIKFNMYMFGYLSHRSKLVRKYLNSISRVSKMKVPVNLVEYAKAEIPTSCLNSAGLLDSMLKEIGLSLDAYKMFYTCASGPRFSKYIEGFMNKLQWYINSEVVEQCEKFYLNIFENSKRVLSEMLNLHKVNSTFNKSKLKEIIEATRSNQYTSRIPRPLQQTLNKFKKQPIYLDKEFNEEGIATVDNDIFILNKESKGYVILQEGMLIGLDYSTTSYLDEIYEEDMDGNKSVDIPQLTRNVNLGIEQKSTGTYLMLPLVGNQNVKEEELVIGVSGLATSVCGEYKVPRLRSEKIMLENKKLLESKKTELLTVNSTELTVVNSTSLAVAEINKDIERNNRMLEIVKNTDNEVVTIPVEGSIKDVILASVYRKE